jgi:uncharacterized ferritin-like protein (DUF455 family)
MELSEFAEKVLFATTLEEKLSCPALITDESPGLPRPTPEAPGRPPELQFKPRGSRAGEFPGGHHLEKDSERGRLLHFFANHELLATELMALVLLKFPDAPAAFRRGVLRTLKEEQEHTRLYLQRMQECGIHFGAIPVSGYFWRAVAGMENPMDYVAGLSLTFEQANLDYCRQFARGFEAAGDPATARLLEQIYRDEIGHVAYGLKWFRRWKNPQESDWEAFCHQLKFPLSPNRAKGILLNVEGRRAAGFDADFVDELNVYSQSKGRTPSVFVFNPFVEAQIAQGRTFTPTKQQALLAGDLANLPQFLCRQDDIVVVPRRPSVQFLSSIKQAGFPLPEFVEAHRGQLDPTSSVCHRKLGSLRPWAWGPDSVALFGPLFANVTGEQRNAGECFNAGIAQLYSKGWSATFLRQVLQRFGDESCLCGEAEVGVEAKTLQDALDVIANIRGRGHQKVVVKESYGLAGHKMLRLWEPELLESQRRWIQRAVEHRRSLVIEPWLEREVDFSVQLESCPDGLRFLGYTGLINDHRGQFQANWVAADSNRKLPAQVTNLFPANSPAAATLRRVFDQIISLLQPALRKIGYIGPLGIDAFVYRTNQGEFRLKPMVEINPRHTMGRVTLELMKQACPGSTGVFRLVNRAMVRSEGFGSFADYAQALANQAPLRLEGSPRPRIREGALCLNDPAAVREYLAVFRVGRNFDDAARGMRGSASSKIGVT